MSETISMQKGTARTIDIPVRDQNGAPLDLSGAQAATFEVAASVQGGTVVMTKTLAAATITITSDGATPPLYTLSIDVLPADTENAEPRDSYYYEASVVDSGGNPYVVASGQFELEPSLTT